MRDKLALAVSNSQSSSLYVKAVSACAGAITTSILVTPLDVVKVRMQAVKQPPPPHLSLRPSGMCVHNLTPASCNRCSHFNFSTVAEHAVMKERSRHFSRGVTSGIGSNMGALSVMRSIVRTDGFLALWDGLSPTLLMAVPNTVVYMILYDEMSHSILPNYGFGKYSPAVAGALARIAAGTMVAPLELVRTQMQASSKDASRGVVSKIGQIVREQGVRALWRGLEPTLWRDVPFSAIYWLGYEKIAQRLEGSNIFSSLYDNESVSVKSQFATSFVAGAGAGAFAAYLTTPFDVIKTRRQVYEFRGSSAPPKMMHIIGNILRDEGVSSLFAGVTPRVAKVAPACAIMIAAYDIGKLLLLRN